MFRFARFDEPLLKDLEENGKKDSFENVKGVPKNLRRNSGVNLPDIDETQMVRHFFRLSQMNFGVENGLYPLGSCTMKYNPKLCENVAGWERFCCTSPLQEPLTVQGNLQVLFELERMLCEITGMDYFSLQPLAGAHGEFLGMLLARAYHEDNGESWRDEVIIPDTAHGTNPASASMAGYKITEIPSNKDGMVNLKALKKALSSKTACFMLTNPNTLGIFESDIQKIAEMVHDAGALLYYDGANMNAIMGKVRPGDMGFDIVHLNLHKTFSTPHGGGGPGSGPVGVNIKLEKFLPVPRVGKTSDDEYVLDYDAPDSIGKISNFYGNFSSILKAYVYISMMGGDGLREVSENAVLNSNYMKEKILKSGKYEMPYKKLRKHEFVLSCEQLKKDKDIRAMDIAKRLLDYGIHPPTVYFPLIVKEALMIEPTETESKKDLDNYIETLIKIADEKPELLKNAPQNTPVKRIDEVNATKNPVLNWNMIKK
jgi:glycine dehydrogenase subunit 2